MPTVADYDIVSDVPVELSKGKTHDFPLETPGIAMNTRTVLSFMVVPLSEKPLSFDMFIVNGKDKKDIGKGNFQAHGEGVWRTFQKVVDVGVFTSKPTGNVLRVAVESGEGFFSDIVLWYQTKV